MSKKQSAKYAEALELAKAALEDSSDCIAFWNKIFGIGGTVTNLFSDRTERTEFMKSNEYAEIMKLMDGLPGDGQIKEHSGKVLLRLPASLHSALVAEADLEGVSLNQLILTKLAMQLRAMVS